MKKITLIAMLLFAFSVYLPAQSEDANQAYIKAVTTQDPAQKAQLLKDFINKYGGKGVQNENYAYATLATLDYPGKTSQETIQYGEKALELGGLDDLTTYQICIVVAGNLNQLGQNLTKAKSLAERAVQIAKANKNKADSGDPGQWAQMEGAGYFVQAQAMEKANDLKGAITAYTNSYNILKNNQIIGNLAKIGKSLYDAKAYSDAAKAFKTVMNVNKDFASTALYAKALHRAGNKDEALTYYKQAYQKEKNGEIAYNIGLILAGKVESNPALVDETIQYFLEASFLSPANSENAMKYAESLYFNKDPEYNERIKTITEKVKVLEELTNTFNEKYATEEGEEEEEEEEEELTEEEEKEIAEMLAKIDELKKEIEALQAEQQAYLDKFQALIDATKTKLGLG
jgi:tetratricopeptide (TPR) repeat protein